MVKDEIGGKNSGVIECTQGIYISIANASQSDNLV